MYLRKSDGPRVVNLPDGSTLSLADLPSPKTRRWVARRKALVARAVEYGLLEWEEADRRYNLSEEELASWVAAHSSHGITGLKITRLRELRNRQ